MIPNWPGWTLLFNLGREALHIHDYRYSLEMAGYKPDWDGMARRYLQALEVAAPQVVAQWALDRHARAAAQVDGLMEDSNGDLPF